MEMKNMLIDIGADDKEDAKKLELSPVNKLFRFVLLHQWQMRRKSLQRRGTIVMDVVYRLNY